MYARSHARLLLPALAIALLAGGCDKNSNPATPADAAPAARDGDAAAPEPAAAATEPGAPGVTWADKTFKQRQEHMGIVFFPKMKKMFKAHDETTYKGFK